MKAGTTSLCNDLDANPEIFFPTVKEPHTLVFDDVLKAEGKRKYAELFKNAQENQVLGEGSTGYSKIPLHMGVPKRARELLGSSLKLVYIVRDPVDRAFSHHYHMYRGGDAPANFGEAIKTIPLIIQCSKYAMQLEAWLEEFNQENILVIKFEDYISDREESICNVYRFLGVSESQEIEAEEVHNAGEDQMLPPKSAKNLIRKITRSQWYKRKIHPNTPVWMRTLFKSTFYKKAHERPPITDPDDVVYLIDQLNDDVEKLGKILGHDSLFWDLNERKKHL